MALLFPRQDTLQHVLGNPVLGSRRQNGLGPRGTHYQARPELYGAYSIVDDAKDKAQKLSDKAAKEFDLASQKAPVDSGKIELYSNKYYAACTFGGLLACVSDALRSPGFTPSKPSPAANRGVRA